MYRHILIATAFMSCTLFATPSMSSADNQPNKPDLENQTIEVARDADAKKVDSKILSSKLSQYTQSEDNGAGVDCFYEANKANPDCSNKPDQR